jgi:cytoskeleton protein RodZ
MNDSIGDQLRQAREARSLSLEEASQATYMRLSYLRALESGDFDALPSRTQARGFLRAYASYLGLEEEPILAALDASQEQGEPSLKPAKTASPTINKSAPPPEAEAIFNEIGQRLRRQRELLGLSLEDVERHTRLRLHQLKRLEEGDFDAFPSPVQGRGMLNNYAIFLGLDPETLLLRYADGLQARLAIRHAPKPLRRSLWPIKVRLPSFLPRWLSVELFITVIVIAFLIGFVVWGMGWIFSMNEEQEPTPTAPSIADVLLAPQTPSETPETLTPTAIQPAVLPAIVNQPIITETLETQALTLPGLVQLNITIRQRAWMRVLVDSKVEFEGRVLPGAAYQFSGEKQVEILTGNAAALQVLFNQKDMGTLGTFGQVIDQIYTVEGILAPTPSLTPSPTDTLRPSPTSRVTPTPSITPQL